MDTTEKNIYIIDDSSATFNSRDFMSENNKALNNRIITMRPHQNCVIFTTPAKSLLDVVLRKMSGYQVFLKEPLFEIGKSVCDIRRVKIDLISEKEKVYRPQLQNHRGEKYRLHIFNKPPQAWCDEYDTRRAAAEKILSAKSRETIEKSYKEQISPRVRKSDLYKQIYEEFKSGKFGEISLKEICRQKKIPYQSVLNCQGS